jgi:S1-C subfamily serine protease
MRPALAALLIVLASAPTVPAAEVTIQEVLLRTKPAVALVVSEVSAEVTLRCPGGAVTVTPPALRETGTGWLVNPHGWVITNAHVVSPAHQPTDRVRDLLARKAARPGCPVSAVTLDPSIAVILSNGVRLTATVAKYSAPVAGEAMSGRDLALLKVEATDLPALLLGDSAALKIGDGLHILGFPGVVLTHELLNASTKVEASVTHGAVSGFREDRAGQPVIQTDAPAAEGNSGGPVTDSQGRVVGVLTSVPLSPGEEDTSVQGFNFVIPAAAVREFLAGTGARLDEPGRFNEAWHAALRDFFAGDHRRAGRALAEANRLLPELPDVRRVTAENTAKLENPPPRPVPWAVVAAVVSVVSLTAYGVFVGRRWRRNRFRVKPAEVARMLDSPRPPAILDVRSASAFAKSPVRIPHAVHVPPEVLQTGQARVDIEPDRTVVAYCT